MTPNDAPKLLPLPGSLTNWIGIHAAHSADYADVCSFVENYARANVEASCAELIRQRDAYKAEVERHVEARAASQARAEQLAEALREVVADMALAVPRQSGSVSQALVCGWRKKLLSALTTNDAQPGEKM